MKVSELLRAECVRAGSSADDKALALCELASLAKNSPVCRNVSEEEILEALQDRETLGATGLGNGIAIPHCRLRGVDDFVVGLMTVPDGVDFEAEDGKKVQLLVFIIAPPQESNTHIRLLSQLSRLLQDSNTVAQMIGADTHAELASLFMQAAGEEVEAPQSLKYNQVHIYVQDNDVFRHILEAISSVEGISLSIFEGVTARCGLIRTPLYAQFADNDAPSESKLIVAMVERQLSNEIIRRIETLTGSLLECTGILVTVQELSYLAGSLEM